MKKCSTCKQTKDRLEFGNLKASKDGKSGRCKSCLNTSNRRSQAKTPDVFDEQRRLSWLTRNYGITTNDYNSMVVNQDDKCGICERQDKGTRRKYWCVDHCHTTGRVRGLLCATCNKSLGQLGDTVESLQKAITYLKHTKP